jgi:hypothetical protein
MQFFVVPGSVLDVSAATLTFTLSPGTETSVLYNGSVSGSMSLTGTVAGSTTETLVGPVSGNYIISK